MTTHKLQKDELTIEFVISGNNAEVKGFGIFILTTTLKAREIYRAYKKKGFSAA